jgi:hypothetical protein
MVQPIASIPVIRTTGSDRNRSSDTWLTFSCAPVPGDVQILRGTEDMLLWRHWIETGLATEANYGRFYPGYARPTNR